MQPQDATQRTQPRIIRANDMHDFMQEIRDEEEGPETEDENDGGHEIDPFDDEDGEVDDEDYIDPWHEKPIGHLNGVEGQSKAEIMEGSKPEFRGPPMGPNLAFPGLDACVSKLDYWRLVWSLEENGLMDQFVKATNAYGRMFDKSWNGNDTCLKEFEAFFGLILYHGRALFNILLVIWPFLVVHLAVRLCAALCLKLVFLSY